MAFRKKAAPILALKPDLLVVPECEETSKISFADSHRKPADQLWFGSNPHKGLGIFSFGKYRLELLPVYEPKYKLIIPIAVTAPDIRFNLYAVWANNPSDPDGTYVEQVWKAIRHYDKELNSTDSILIGDFNSNTIWDRKSRVGNHSDLVRVLAEKGIHSSYHLHHDQVHGKEKKPTHFLYRHKDKPYHLDYCFMSSSFNERLRDVEIGDYKKWRMHSDHVPVIITLRKKRKRDSNSTSSPDNTIVPPI